MPDITLDTTNELVPTPIWALYFLAHSPAVTSGSWLVQSGGKTEVWENQAFTLAYEPEPEATDAPSISPDLHSKLMDWSEAMILMRQGIKIARITWPPTDFIEWDKELNRVTGVDASGTLTRAGFTPIDTTSKVWKVWGQPTKPTEESLEPFDWDSAFHLLKAGHKVRQRGWKPGIFISMSEGKPRLWRNGAGEAFHPSDTSLKIWVLA